MALPRDDQGKPDGLAPNDDLGNLIRWGLKDSYAGTTPPHDLWPKILARVQERPTPTPSVSARAPRWRSLSLAPLVQAVVVSSLLLAFGLRVDRNVATPRREQPAALTPVIERATVESGMPQDIPNRPMRVKAMPQMPVRHRAGGVTP
jgi:hypothetical protein